MVFYATFNNVLVISQCFLGRLRVQLVLLSWHKPVSRNDNPHNLERHARSVHIYIWLVSDSIEELKAQLKDNATGLPKLTWSHPCERFNLVFLFSVDSDQRVHLLCLIRIWPKLTEASIDWSVFYPALNSRYANPETLSPKKSSHNYNQTRTRDGRSTTTPPRQSGKNQHF